MATITRPDTLRSELDDLKRRVSAIENGRSLEFSGIKNGRLKVVDNNNIERASMGLQDDGTYGLKLNDPGGIPIFDPTGLVGVEKRVGGNGPISTSPQAFTTTPTNLPGSNGSFTLTRPWPPGSSILVLSQLNFYTNGGSASYGFAELLLVDHTSAIIAGSPTVVHTNSEGISSSSPYLFVEALDPDTYTVWVQYWLSPGASTTWQLYSGQWDAFQMGS